MKSYRVGGLTYDVHGGQGEDETGAAPATVFLSSGLGGAAGYWRAQIAPLVAARWRVITYDQRGTGRSRGDLPSAYTIADMAGDVLEILDHSKTGSCHFFGHALGGLVGLELGLAAPQRILSLGLLNAWDKVARHTRRCFATRLLLLETAGLEAYVEAQPLFLYPAAWSEAHGREIEEEVAHAIAHFPGRDVMIRRIDALKAFDVSTRLLELRMPVWVSAATDDVLVPWTASERLARTLPDATFDLVTSGGHAHNVTQPQTFNRGMLDFLNKRTAS